MLSIMKDIVLAACTIITSFGVCCLLVGFGKLNSFVLCYCPWVNDFFVLVSGWYVVWKLFLSKFKLIREVLDSVNGVHPVEEPRSKTKSKKARRD